MIIYHHNVIIWTIHTMVHGVLKLSAMLTMKSLWLNFQTPCRMGVRDATTLTRKCPSHNLMRPISYDANCWQRKAIILLFLIFVNAVRSKIFMWIRCNIPSLRPSRHVWFLACGLSCQCCYEIYEVMSTHAWTDIEHSQMNRDAKWIPPHD